MISRGVVYNEVKNINLSAKQIVEHILGINGKKKKERQKSNFEKKIF